MQFICNGSGKDIVTVARYAKSRGNRFPRLIKELAGAKNADDVYCSAVIKLARPLGESVENTSFCLFNEAVKGNKKAEENFIEMWDSLKKINRLCGSFNDCI